MSSTGYAITVTDYTTNPEDIFIKPDGTEAFSKEEMNTFYIKI
jgi:hypothetical protein